MLGLSEPTSVCSCYACNKASISALPRPTPSDFTLTVWAIQDCSYSPFYHGLRTFLGLGELRSSYVIPIQKETLSVVHKSVCKAIACKGKPLQSCVLAVQSELRDTDPATISRLFLLPSALSMYYAGCKFHDQSSVSIWRSSIRLLHFALLGGISKLSLWLLRMLLRCQAERRMKVMMCFTWVLSTATAVCMWTGLRRCAMRSCVELSYPQPSCTGRENRRSSSVVSAAKKCIPILLGTAPGPSQRFDGCESSHLISRLVDVVRAVLLPTSMMQCMEPMRSAVLPVDSPLASIGLSTMEDSCPVTILCTDMEPNLPPGIPSSKQEDVVLSLMGSDCPKSTYQVGTTSMNVKAVDQVDGAAVADIFTEPLDGVTDGGESLPTYTKAVRYLDIGAILYGRSAVNSKLGSSVPCVRYMGVNGVRLVRNGIHVYAHANTLENLQEAYRKRVIMKKKKFVGTGDDVNRIKRTVSAFKRLITPERVTEVLVECGFDIAELKSKKWTSERFSSAIDNLNNMLYLSMKHDCQVKNEVLPCVGDQVKPPRLLIADGDTGQVMALAAVAVMEKVCCSLFQRWNIKGADKHSKMADLARDFASVVEEETVVIEGDGSAWDTTCNHDIRRLTENVILAHVGRLINAAGFGDPTWTDVHEKSCGKKKMKVGAKVKATEDTGLKFSYSKSTIDAFRRSGHRGTSILNFVINIIMWATALTNYPEEFFDSGSDMYTCRYTMTRHFRRMKFEGDDSILRLPRHLLQYKDEIEGFWGRCGFNMKLKYIIDGTATFTGWHFSTSQGRFFEDKRFRCPEVFRCLAGMSWTTSPQLLSVLKPLLDKKFKMSDKNIWAAVDPIARRVACSSLISRAQLYAGHDWRMSSFCLALARGANPDMCGGLRMTMDDAYKSGNCTLCGMDYSVVIDAINCANADHPQAIDVVGSCDDAGNRVSISWDEGALGCFCASGDALAWQQDVSHLLPKVCD